MDDKQIKQLLYAQRVIAARKECKPDDEEELIEQVAKRFYINKFDVFNEDFKES